MGIGLSCGHTAATLESPLRSCNGIVSSTLLTLPQSGKENPDRVQPRNLFDFATGTDNVFRAEHYKTSGRFTLTNLTNKVALYNFLYTFSSTHFVPPRTCQVSIGYAF